MKTLITIAGTLLAGATPFAASAALGNEAATNPAVQEAVVLRRAAQAPPKQAEELELDELRRAIAELRAEKERLRTELSTTQVQGIPLLDRLYGTAVEPRALGEAERLYAVERKLALEQEAAAEEYDRALADLENAEHGLYLDLQAVPSEDGKRIEVRPRLSEAQQKRARAELERKAQRERAAWALAAPGQDAQEHYEVKMKSDEQGRWQLVTERVAETSPETGGGALGGLARVYVVQDDAGDAAEVQTEALQRLLEAELSERATKETIEVLLKELAAQDAERAPVVRRKRFVFEGEPLEIDVDSLPEGKSQRRIYVRTDGDQRFGAIAVEPQDEPRQVRVDEDVWVQLGDEGHAIYSTQGGGQSGATIHALPSREGETRVRTERRVFVRGEDGALVELELRPDAPADPRAPEAPGAPAAPRVSLGFSGTPPQAGAPERKEVRWFDSSSAPQPSASSSTDRDELLREVHVLTKEMLAELKLLRAAVDDLRRDVDSHHRASGSGLR